MNKKFLCHFRSEGGSLLRFGFLFFNSNQHVHTARARKIINLIKTYIRIQNASSFLLVVYLWQILYMKIKYKSKEVHQLPKHSHGHERLASFDNDDMRAQCPYQRLLLRRCCYHRCAKYSVLPPLDVDAFSDEKRTHKIHGFDSVWVFERAICGNFSASLFDILHAKTESQVIIS